MATTRFNANILAAAGRLKDRRTDPSATGDANMRFSSDRLADYQNKAIKDIIVQQYGQLGPKFADVFPELIRTFSPLTTDVTGIVALPMDCWKVIEASKWDKSQYYYAFKEDPLSVENNKDGLIVPAVDAVYWYQQYRELHVLPAAAYTVAIRYLMHPADLLVQISVGTNGKWSNNPLACSYSASLRLFVGNMTPLSFSIDDVGKVAVLRSSNAVYYCRIAAVVNGTTVALTGEGLPAASIPVGDLCEFLVADNGNLYTDIPLSPLWDSLIVSKMVEYGMMDAKHMMQ